MTFLRAVSFASVHPVRCGSPFSDLNTSVVGLRSQLALLQLRTLPRATLPQQLALVQALALSDQTLSHRLLSPSKYIHYCVPVTHNTCFRSKSLRSATEPCPTRYGPLATTFITVCH